MSLMEFEEQLRHAFDNLAARLRDEIAAQLNAVVADIIDALEADCARIAGSVDVVGCVAVLRTSAPMKGFGE